MELEQRVKSLEYEMKILKNEVQRTLLDIQEQILIHYYPSLRAEESVPTQSIESVRDKRRQLEEASNAPGAKEASHSPEVTPVSLQDVKAVQKETPVSEEGGQEDRAGLVELSGWVSRTAQKIGGESTARLIQTCVTKGVVAPDLESSLLRLTGLTTGGAPKQVSTNDVLSALLKLDELLGRAADVEEALSIIEEAGLG